MYLPIGDDAQDARLIDWYDTMCEANRLSSPDSAAWYCRMATYMRNIKATVKPPPPPDPPPFVAVDAPPEEIAKGSSHEQWWADKAAREERNKKLMLLGAVGLGAYLILSRR